jgi:hypothetical protein
MQPVNETVRLPDLQAQQAMEYYQKLYAGRSQRRWWQESDGIVAKATTVR